VEPSTGGEGHQSSGYDGFDLLVDGLLEIELQPRETQERDPEMVHYEPTPARAILRLIDLAELGPDDVFFDLGSGLGRVAILVNLLTGIRTVGVEYEPAYWAYACSRARGLGLTSVEFIRADVRDVDYANGTVFFMFTPFRGKLLQTVLDRLEQEARIRPLRICTYGSCTLYAYHQKWLQPVDKDANHEYSLAVFHSLPPDLLCQRRGTLYH
jgi:SAM-dependent methyltransferase